MPHGMPSHDTLRRVLARLDPDECTHCFLPWTHALSERSAGEIVAIDGQTLRRSFDRAASMVESRREVGGHGAEETRSYLTSLPCDATQFAQAVREHWGVEHALHWVLDVSFRADDCRMRKAKGAQNFAVLRHSALHLLQRESGHKRGIKARRKRAGWDRQYLIKVFMG
jgi:predicted transposase YbfD/YdcC